jgi:hypothetical protein
MTKVHRRSGGLAVLAAAATIGLAACGGSSSPHVASLGNSSGTTPGTTTTLPKGNPTQLLDEWATCMRSHGMPGLADPTIDANGVIHIILPAANSGPTGFKTDQGPCGSYLTAASTALRGGQPLQKPDPAKLLKYSQCMQSHGIPDFPDPSGGGLSIRVSPGSDLNPQSPTFQAAAKLCTKLTGVPGPGGGPPPRGGIEVQGGGGPAGGPGGNGGSKAGIATQGIGSGAGGG